MPTGLQRHYGQGDLHFVTFSCYHRHPFLETTLARNCFTRVLGEVRNGCAFLLVGYVVMPDHVHLLISEPKQGTPSDAVQVLKQRVSRELRGKERLSSSEQLGCGCSHTEQSPLRFWQSRFFDFNVWSRAKLKEKLGYMHRNPVKNGLVEDPKDWAWSSYMYYAHGEQGLVSIDPLN
jgi:REP-associated tyrosine transposase